jgi:hypothetical protein
LKSFDKDYQLINDRELKGITLLKKRILQLAGFRYIEIPFWDAANLTKEQVKENILAVIGKA